MSKKSIHDLVAFQRSIDLVVDVYDVSTAFPRDERFGLTAQIRRAAVGIPSQIAEGHGRLHYSEWRQLLSQARGSLFEVEAQSIVAMRLGFIGLPAHDRLLQSVARTGKALVGLIKWVRAQERSTARPRDRETPQPR